MGRLAGKWMPRRQGGSPVEAGSSQVQSEAECARDQGTRRPTMLAAGLRRPLCRASRSPGLPSPEAVAMPVTGCGVLCCSLTPAAPAGAVRPQLPPAALSQASRPARASSCCSRTSGHVAEQCWPLCLACLLEVSSLRAAHPHGHAGLQSHRRPSRPSASGQPPSPRSPYSTRLQAHCVHSTAPNKLLAATGFPFVFVAVVFRPLLVVRKAYS